MADMDEATAALIASLAGPDPLATHHRIKAQIAAAAVAAAGGAPPNPNPPPPNDQEDLALAMALKLSLGSDGGAEEAALRAQALAEHNAARQQIAAQRQPPSPTLPRRPPAPPVPPPPPAQPCASCADPSEFDACTCSPPHRICEANGCFSGAVCSQLAAGTPRCPFADPPPFAASSGGGGGGGGGGGSSGAAAVPSPAKSAVAPVLLGSTLSAVLRKGFHPTLTAKHEQQLMRLTIGPTCLTCPLAACPGFTFSLGGKVGVPVQCAIGARDQSSVPRCPALFCENCGEKWKAGHLGKPCGDWRPPPPPPEGCKYCPGCRAPFMHNRDHGCALSASPPRPPFRA